MRIIINRIIQRCLCMFHAYKYHVFYNRILKINKIKRKNDEGKAIWKEKWSQLRLKPDDIYYDVFSHYMDESLDIVPENICHDVIERILNPVHYDGYYADKNNFDQFFPKGFMPETIIRMLNGFYKDADYLDICLNDKDLNKRLDDSGYKRIVVKPTLDSCSGKGVRIVEKQGGCWKVVGSNELFSYDYLEEKYGNDFIIQQAMEQSDYISQFNPTSVNTLRLTVYRSVKTNECIVPSAVIRIGGKGALMDNAHQGGVFTAISPEGLLGKKVFNQYGESQEKFNGIDFGKSEFKIPNYNKVIDFAKEVGRRVLHHRLIALDIMLDKDNNPHLIEFNTGTSGAYGMWVFQYAGQPPFGTYTQEIIDYCKEHLNDIQMQIYF